MSPTQNQYPNLTAAGIDWQTLLRQLEQTLAPILAQAAVAFLEALLGKLKQKKGQPVKCPSGDCADLCAHLDSILGSATQTICDAMCSKALCNQQCP